MERQRGADGLPARPERGGVDVFDSLLVRQPVTDADAVRRVVAEWVPDEGDIRTLLPAEDATLVTLFLDAGAAELVWYVEVLDDDAPNWVDPAATVRRSPLFDTGLDELVTGPATVLADGVRGCQLATHATHPDRQRRYRDHVGRSLVAPVAGDDLSLPVAVVAVPLKPGLVSRLTSLAIRVANRLKTVEPVAARAREATDTLVEEAMYTESLLFEPVGDRLVLHYYMETEAMDRLYAAYEASGNWDVRVSDWVMRRVFEAPETMLEPPLTSDAEVLVHAVDPTRP